jgi:hypothetical protein
MAQSLYVCHHQIDGNLGGAASMSEMLVQSYWSVIPANSADSADEPASSSSSSSNWLTAFDENEYPLMAQVDILPALPMNEVCVVHSVRACVVVCLFFVFCVFFFFFFCLSVSPFLFSCDVLCLHHYYYLYQVAIWASKRN